MSRPRCRAPLALALGLLVATSPVRPAWASTDFDRYLGVVVHYYQELDYERALQQLRRTRRLATTLQQDVLVSLYEGILLAELGQWEKARASFESALMLDPEAKLPVAVSPKVQRELETQRERVRQELAKRG